MTPEGVVKRDIKAYLKTIDRLWFFMPVPTGYGVRGLPDFVGCYRGRFFAIEAKSGTGTVSPWQHKMAENITMAGGVWLLVRDVEQIKHVFQ